MPMEEEIWCAGLPLAFRRQLLPEEQTTLALALKRGRVRGGIAVILTPIIFLLWVALMIVALLPSNERFAILSILVLLTVTGLLVGAIFTAYEQLKSVDRIPADLRRGEVLHFEGVLQTNPIDETQKAFLNSRRPHFPALRPEYPHPQVIEILAVSKRVWTVNGELALRSRITARPRTIAKTPEFASIAEQWLQPVPTPDAHGEVLAGQRELSASEKTELLTRAKENVDSPSDLHNCLDSLGGQFLE